MFRDPTYFERPDDFWPERFILHPLGVKPDVKDDPERRPNLLFGGGRRVCPGITFVKYTMVRAPTSLSDQSMPDVTVITTLQMVSRKSMLPT